jgi:feruloyl esterase
MAAPQQAHTVDAIRCYRELEPDLTGSYTDRPKVMIGSPKPHPQLSEPPALSLLTGRLPFGEALTHLLELARATESRQELARELFGIWLSRAFPVAAVQLGAWSSGRRTIITRHYKLPEDARPPAWLDPECGGVADPGLFHTVFLPVNKLIEIGRLTTFPQNKGTNMINLGPKMAAFAKLRDLAGQARHRQKWEKLLEFFSKAQAWTDTLDARESRLVEVADFGSNPGNLRMFTYVPQGLPDSAPLVVLLHGATQNAMSYDRGSGWSTLADKHGFALLLPQQHWTNNPLRAFNWFRTEDTVRDSGETLSIKQMVDRAVADHRLDKNRVYITGVSSGGAMTTAMLGNYPDVFAGGAIIAGLPCGAASNLQEAFEAMFQGGNLTPQEWGNRVRSASSHQGPWPRVSVWHGDADAAVKPINADNIVTQWANVHGLDTIPSHQTTINGHPHRIWRDADGESLIESYTITGMSHGLPLEPGDQPHQCGTAAPYFLDVGISSTYRIATFFGVTEGKAAQEQVQQSTRENQTPRPDPSAHSAVATARETTEEPLEGEVLPAGTQSENERDETRRSSKKSQGDASFGIDVQAIIKDSLAAAGLYKNSPESRSKTDAPLGIDIPGIISASLEAASVLGESARQSKKAQSTKTSTASAQTASSEWQGDGWELLHQEPGAIQGGSILYGQAASGNGCDVGRKSHAISRQVTLGQNPRLSYLRRLDLNAGVNDYTKASFSVLVDGLPVDEVSAVGMDHKESEWMQRSDIDLKPFAERTVTLTLEVAANSNVCNEVTAKAWVDRITLRDTSTAN